MSPCVCVCARSVRDAVVRRVFPHLTEAFQDCDNGPHYQNSAKILTLVDNHKRTGLKIVISCSCEPGEGKWFVDAKFSHIKRHHAKNIKYDSRYEEFPELRALGASQQFSSQCTTTSLRAVV